MAHKGLGWTSIPWRFTEKEAIAFSGQGSVPVIVDGEKVVSDSWQIALYLDQTYPGARLIDSDQARGTTLAFKVWCERSIHPLLMQAVMGDLFSHIHPMDRAYFRSSREKRFGRTLESFAPLRDEAIENLQNALECPRAVIREQAFLGGKAASFADHILFGAFQWARTVSPVHLLKGDDVLYGWRERMLDAYGGLARNALGYPV